MRFQILIAGITAAAFLGHANAQATDLINSGRINSLAALDLAAAQVVVVTGTAKGQCTPEMPMLKPNVAYQIQLQATADKTFVLESNDFNLHLKAAPGKTVSQVITPTAAGNFNFTCGDEALPEQQRTQGMFMVMDM